MPPPIFQAPGAKDWQPSAFSPRTGLLYIPHNNLCMDFQGMEANYIAGTPFVGANVRMYPGPGGNRGFFTAWDLAAHKPRWQIKEQFPAWSGALATAGDVVFYGTMEGWFKAVNAATGQELWRFKTGSGIIGQPVLEPLLLPVRIGQVIGVRADPQLAHGRRSRGAFAGAGGERQHQEAEAEDSGPLGPHSPGPSLPASPPSRRERGEEVSQKLLAVLVFLPLLPSGREGGWEKRAGVMRANLPGTQTWRSRATPPPSPAALPAPSCGCRGRCSGARRRR